MIRFVVEQKYSDGTIYAEGFCKSTDVKPTKINGLDLITGSSLYEVDTSDAYLYEESGQTWIKQGNSETAQEETPEEVTQEGD